MVTRYANNSILVYRRRYGDTLRYVDFHFVRQATLKNEPANLGGIAGMIQYTVS